MFRAPCLILLTLFSASIEAKVPDAATLAARAERAIKAGDVVPERDLAPLIEALKRTDDEDELRRVIDKVETIGRGDGDSPAAVKRYLLEKATPLLLQIGREAHDTFARGDALTALRNMGASRAVLEEAATIAERDNNDYVKSRGEILRNFIQSMPKQAGSTRSSRRTPAASARRSRS
jgi:hypothetical protein